MSFRQISRGPTVKTRPQRLSENRIALQWWANPTAPYLGILLGNRIARSIGIGSIGERVHFLLGEGHDVGLVGVERSAHGSWWCKVRGGTYSVFLDSEVSNQHFSLIPRIEVDHADITLRGNTVFFRIPDSVRKPAKLSGGGDQRVGLSHSADHSHDKSSVYFNRGDISKSGAQ